jgi:hypothetical protein
MDYLPSKSGIKALQPSNTSVHITRYQVRSPHRFLSLCVYEYGWVTPHGVPPAQWHGSFPCQNNRTSRQYASSMPLLFAKLGFLLRGTSSYAHYGFVANFHHVSMAWVSGPDVCLTHIHTPWTHKASTSFPADEHPYPKDTILTK